MKKRTCNGCKCIYYGCNGNISCELKYPIHVSYKWVEAMHCSIPVPVPEIECPKPRTYKQWLQAEKYKET